MEPSPTLVAQKLSNMIRVAFLVIQNGISKTKFMLHLHLIIKRGKILAKALNDLLLEHQTSLSCRSHDLHMSFVSPAVAVGCRPQDVHMSFVSPRDYEFSCSSTPSYRPYRRRTHYNHRKDKGYYGDTRYHAPPHAWNDVESETGDVTEASVNNLVGRGFGWSPVGREVRITDSPFSVRDSGDREDCPVDKEAEKFIERFYKELRVQKRMAAREAANRNMI